MVKILLKRIYEEPSEADGYRILLDRLWPRGLKKEDAKFDEWRKTSLHPRSYANGSTRIKTGIGKYSKVATGWRSSRTRISFLSYERSKHPVVTFLTAAKDVQHSHLPILKEVIEDFEKNKS